MTDLSRVGRNCVNGKHTIEILEGQERRGEERLLTNSCVGGPLSSLPLPLTQGPHSDAKGVSQQVWGGLEAKKVPQDGQPS